MTELLTSAQMRAIESAAIASGAVTGLELMERAGAGVVAAVLEEWPEMALTAHRAVVLCGPGGNGGDGFVVARLLRERGWEVEVFLYGDPEKMPPDARVNYERWRGMGEVKALDCEGFWLDAATTNSDTLLIDAIFGIGLNRPFVCDAASTTLQFCATNSAIDWHYWPSARVVAIDAPSGLDADSGSFLLPDPVPPHLEVAQANLTVTFHRPKIGHMTGKGPDACGKVVVKDIGLKSDRFPDRKAFVIHNSDERGLLPKFGLHKYTHGHALILSGPPGHGGAARLSARGALRIGAGVVTVGAMPEAIAEHAAHLNAIMLRAVGDAAALAAVLEDRRINAICLGPGLGVDARAAELVAVALGLPPTSPPAPLRSGEGGGTAPPAPPLSRGRGDGGEGCAIVLDADALTLLARDPALFAQLHDRCVLTPHAGEFARLFPDIAAKLAEPATRGPAWSKVDATREAAKRAGCVVLYKGPDTLIADPSGRCSINAAHYDRAAPWLATAGSGDVLAGFICGLLARGFAPMQAAETAAWLHVECALKFGPGLIAEDLPEMLPQVFRGLGV